jgi:hypothetical protein
MSNALGGISNADIRGSIGTFSNGQGILAVDGSNVENLQTTGAVEHSVNGVQMTDLATIAEWDLSGAVVLSAKDAAVLSATKIHPAIATADNGGEAQTIVYIFACRGNVPYIIESTIDVAAAQDDAKYELTCPKGYAPFGAVKVVQVPTASVGVALFQLGISDLTGITGRTTTVYNLSHCPASVADMVEV